MKIKKLVDIEIEYKMVNDDGTELLPYETEKITKPMQQFKTARVSGKNTYVTDAAALRMAQVVIDNYYIAPRKEEEN